MIFEGALLVLVSPSCAFALVQGWLLEQAILPPHVLVRRNIASGFWASLFTSTHQPIFCKFPLEWIRLQSKSLAPLTPKPLVYYPSHLGPGYSVQVGRRQRYRTPSYCTTYCRRFYSKRSTSLPHRLLYSSTHLGCLPRGS